MDNFVFINYAQEDNEVKSKIVRALQHAQINVWEDKGRLTGGQNWAAEIRDNIRACSYFIALLSATSVNKNTFVKEEIRQALDIYNATRGQIVIVPVKITECKLPFAELEDLQIISYFSDPEKAIHELIGIVGNGNRLYDNIEIIGFDLGHGETSIAVTTSESKGEPRALEIFDNKRSIITALSLTKKGVFIGEDALWNTETDPLNIMFKSSDINNIETHHLIIQFVRECIRRLQESNKIRNDEHTHFIIGYPAGWDVLMQKMYKRLFTEATMKAYKNISLIPESRAAFLESSESEELNEQTYQSAHNILIIDIGSLTTDLTLVKNLSSSPVDIGYNSLGGGLIDALIFSYSMEKLSASDAEQLHAAFSSDNNIRLRCLIKCRMVKERYFKESQTFWETQVASDNYVIEIAEDKHIIFWIRLTKKDMDAILQTPLQSLNNMTWGNTFHNYLVELKEKLLEEPYQVIMTGGASRMGFTQKIVRTVFPNAPLKLSQEPSLSVSKGLAYAGRKDIRIFKFKDEVAIFVKSRQLDSIIEKNVTILAELISKELTPPLIEIMIQIGLRWRVGEIVTLGDYENEVNKIFKDYLDGAEIKDVYKNVFNKWASENLNPEIISVTKTLCKKYDIMDGSISIVNTNDDLSVQGVAHLEAAEGMMRFFRKSAAAVLGTGTLFLLIVGLLSSTLVGVLALSMFDPITILIVAGLVITLALSDVPKSTNVPLKIRRNLIFSSNENVRIKIEKQHEKIYKELTKRYREKLLLEDNIVNLKEPIENMLLESAEKASLLIK